MEMLVFVIKALIGMEAFVYFVLMDKFGIKSLKHVYVRTIMFGTETSVNTNKTVQVEEFSILNIKFVFAPMDKPGMVPLVLQNKNVVVENNGMIQVFNVIAQLLSTGMVELVFSVQAEKYGIQSQDHAFAKLVLNGMVNSALLFKAVKVDQSGTKIHGLANVLQQLFGTTCIVWPILVTEVKFGIMLQKLVFVQEIKS